MVTVSPGDRRLEFDRVIALPELVGPSVSGLPADDVGFIPIDDHCQVRGVPGVYAAGDATDFAIKHGGIASQQADAAAEAIAALAGVDIVPAPLRPVILGVLLTGEKPLYISAHLTGGQGSSSEISETPTWSSPSKIAAKYSGALSRVAREGLGTVTSMVQRARGEDTTETIRIVIADDHAVVRRGLRQVLDGEPGFEVVAEAANLDDARRYVRGHHPDVLVLDLNMPGGSSLEHIPDIRIESPDTQIVVLTMQNEPAYARQALTAGALGYVLKEAAEEELVEAIKRASVGDTYLNPRLGARVAWEPHPGRGDGLSEREVDVLRLIALGYTNAEVGDQLHLSVRTVETHRSHIQQKLSLATRSDLVRYALEHKLIETP